jgi:hypothetical protein
MRRVGVPTILPTGEVVSRRDHRKGRKPFLGMDPGTYSSAVNCPCWKPFFHGDDSRQSFLISCNA